MADKMWKEVRMQSFHSIRAIIVLCIAIIAVPMFFALPEMTSGSLPARIVEVATPWLVALFAMGVVTTLHAVAVTRVFRDFLNDGMELSRTLRAMLLMILVHVAEIQIFGVTLYAYSSLSTKSALAGESSQRLVDYLYFSFATYTSLGLGDIYPIGGLRLLAGLEALTGLLMIGWTASFFVARAVRDWDDPL